ncbi:hypothetical protein ACFPOU_23670 [Massilia jejuensis]|uniref:Uncharacterized protein n=1 Tax=Massilia jejuensis TaxID=648894 RepID=A0ABW0PNQ3_9BURK
MKPIFFFTLFLYATTAVGACSGENIKHSSLVASVEAIKEGNASLFESYRVLPQGDSTRLAAGGLFHDVNSLTARGTAVGDLLYLYDGMKSGDNRTLVNKVLIARAKELAKYVSEDIPAIDRYLGHMYSAGVAAQVMPIKAGLKALKNELSACL